MSRFCIALIVLLMTTNVSAALVNGDFSDPTLTFQDTITEAQAGGGWYARTNTWTITGGKATRDNASNQPNNTERGIAQMFADPTLVGPRGIFSFDYEVTDPAGDVQLPLNFWLVGYTGSGNMDAVEDINTYLILPPTREIAGQTVGQPASGANYTVDVLLEDMLTFNNGSFTGGYRSAVDFGSGYDLFGIAFSAGVQNADQTVSLDNIVVAVPEPTVLALLGLGLAGLGYRRGTRRGGA